MIVVLDTGSAPVAGTGDRSAFPPAPTEAEHIAGLVGLAAAGDTDAATELATILTARFATVTEPTATDRYLWRDTEPDAVDEPDTGFLGPVTPLRPPGRTITAQPVLATAPPAVRVRVAG